MFRFVKNKEDFLNQLEEYKNQVSKEGHQCIFSGRELKDFPSIIIFSYMDDPYVSEFYLPLRQISYVVLNAEKLKEFLILYEHSKNS